MIWMPRTSRERESVARESDRDKTEQERYAALPTKRAIKIRGFIDGGQRYAKHAV